MILHVCEQLGIYMIEECDATSSDFTVDSCWAAEDAIIEHD